MYNALASHCDNHTQQTYVGIARLASELRDKEQWTRSRTDLDQHSMALVNHNPGLAAAIDSALEVARRRAQTLGRIRVALESGDSATAIKLMRAYCGLDDEQKSHSTPSRVN